MFQYLSEGYINQEVLENFRNNKFNPILHGLLQAGSTRGGRHKVLAAFFSETVKATAIKLGTLTN